MTITPAVRSNAANNGATSSTTITSTFTSNAAGNLIVVGVGWVDSGSITATVTDSKGNTYTAVRAKTRNATLGFSFQMFRAWNIAASAGTNTVTATFSSATTFADIHMEEASSSNGAWTSDPLDQSAEGTGSSTALATTAITPGSANQMLATYGGAGSGTITAGSGYVLRGTGANGLGLGDLVQTTAASKAGLLTTSVSDQWGIQVASFKDASGATAKPVTDAGAAADTAVVNATVPLTDAGAAADAIAVHATIALTDSGAAAETLALGFGLPDTGTASDAIAVHTTISLTDSGTASDAIHVTAAVHIADAGAAADAVHTDVAIGVPFMTDLLGPEAVISVEFGWGADPNADPDDVDWSDETERVYFPTKIVINQGRGDETSQAQPASLSMTMVNPNAEYTPDTAISPNWPNIVQNTPIRVRLNLGTGPNVVFYGGLIGSSPTWDTSANLALAVVSAGGTLQRLGQGKTPLNSAQTRALSGSGAIAYNPVEDMAGATRAASALPGGAAMTVSGKVGFAGGAAAPGSAPLADMSGGGLLSMRLPAFSSSSYRTGFTVATPAIASLATAGAVQLQPVGGPSNGVNSWFVDINATGEGGVVISWVGDAGASTDFRATNVNIDDDQPHWIQLDFSDTGGNTTVDVHIDGVAAGGAFPWTVSRDYTVGSRIIAGGTSRGTAVIGSFGQLITWAPWAGTIDAYAAFTGFRGETASDRLARLCAELGLQLTLTGTSTTLMGPQSILAPLALLRECESADQGVLYDGFGPGIGYICRSARYNLTAAVVLDVDAGEVAPPFAPQHDDQRIRNDFTASRTNGSSARVIRTTGPLGTDRIGTYDSSGTYNIAADDPLPSIASWNVHLGTDGVKGLRYPTLGIDFAASPARAPDWLAALPISYRTDVINVSDRATQHAPGDIRLIVEGWNAVLDPKSWKVVENCSAFAPWQIAVVDDASTGRVSSGGATVHTGFASSGAATILLDVPVLFTTDPAKYPQDLNVFGERITISGMTGATSPQTAAVAARSVNGVTRDHDAGEPVDVWMPAIVPL